MVLVPQPGAEEHDNGGAGIWGCSEQLRQGNVEAHGVTQDDGQEEGQRIGLRGESAEVS